METVREYYQYRDRLIERINDEVDPIMMSELNMELDEINAYLEKIEKQEFEELKETKKTHE